MNFLCKKIKISFKKPPINYAPLTSISLIGYCLKCLKNSHSKENTFLVSSYSCDYKRVEMIIRYKMHYFVQMIYEQIHVFLSIASKINSIYIRGDLLQFIKNFRISALSPILQLVNDLPSFERTTLYTAMIPLFFSTIENFLDMLLISNCAEDGLEKSSSLISSNVS